MQKTIEEIQDELRKHSIPELIAFREKLVKINIDQAWAIRFLIITNSCSGPWLIKSGEIMAEEQEVSENNDELLEELKNLGLEGLVQKVELPTEGIQEKARRIVFEYVKPNLEKTDTHVTFAPDEVYVVWFSKTLQNWKAMLSTTLPDGMYYEVTYNGDKRVAYVDAYKKWDNVAVHDIPEG